MSMSVEQTKTDRRKEGRKWHREKGTQAEKERQLSGRQMNSLQRQTHKHTDWHRETVKMKGERGRVRRGGGRKGEWETERKTGRNAGKARQRNWQDRDRAREKRVMLVEGGNYRTWMLNCIARQQPAFLWMRNLLTDQYGFVVVKKKKIKLGHTWYNLPYIITKLDSHSFKVCLAIHTFF